MSIAEEPETQKDQINIARSRLRLRGIKEEISTEERKKINPECPVNPSWLMEECAYCDQNLSPHTSLDNHLARIEDKLRTLREEQRIIERFLESHDE